MRHCESLHLRHKVHGDDHNNEQRGAAEVERHVPLENQEFWQQTDDGDVHGTDQCEAG